jgi:hypothetical protein
MIIRTGHSLPLSSIEKYIETLKRELNRSDLTIDELEKIIKLISKEKE